MRPAALALVVALTLLPSARADVGDAAADGVDAAADAYDFAYPFPAGWIHDARQKYDQHASPRLHAGAAVFGDATNATVVPAACTVGETSCADAEAARDAAAASMTASDPLVRGLRPWADARFAEGGAALRGVAAWLREAPLD